jgi:branched-chain amino acid transport system permease protein
VVIVVAVVFMPRGLADFVHRFRELGWGYFARNVKAHRL